MLYIKKYCCNINCTFVGCDKKKEIKVSVIKTTDSIKCRNG